MNQVNPVWKLIRARSDGGYFILPERSILKISGNDAFRYLNGQITRDLNSLKNDSMMPACILTPKGKLCAPLLIWRNGDELFLETHCSLQEILLARLKRYIISDDVDISIQKPKRCMHVFGSSCAKFSYKESLRLQVTRLGVEGYDIISSHDPDSLLLDSTLIERLRIERGIPAWGSELSEQTLPPEAGLDRTHIDYNRGCYLGQEVISRLKSIGRVNRILQILKAPLNTDLHSGSPIMTEGDIVVGIITSVAPHYSGESCIALGYLHRCAIEKLSPLYSYNRLTQEKISIRISSSIVL